MAQKPPDHELRHELNRRAWAEAETKAKFHFDARRAELFEEAGLPPQRLYPPQQRHREERTRQFYEFIQSLLADDDLTTNDDFLDAIEPFLKKPTTENRIVLYRLLKQNPRWLGDRLAEFMKFA